MKAFPVNNFDFNLTVKEPFLKILKKMYIKKIKLS